MSSISFPSSNKRNNHVMEVSLIALRPCHELGVMPVVIRHHFSSHPSLEHLVMNFSLPFFLSGGVELVIVVISCEYSFLQCD